MRILHLLKTGIGGAWALRLCRELVALGADIHVALPNEGHMPRAFREAGCSVHLLQSDLPLRRPAAIPGTLLALRRLVAQIKPDVIHSHFVGTTLSMRLALPDSKIPRLFQVPGPLHLENPVTRQLEVLSAGPSDHWIATCRAMVGLYRKAGVPARRIHFAYYGIDLNSLKPQSKGQLRAELGLAPEHPIVGMVAYIYAPKTYLGAKRGLKGHEDLIDAIALLRKTHPKVQLVIVGGAWKGAEDYERQIHRYARQRLPHGIHFLGTRTDVPQLYADFDVAVHPSHSENLGGSAESLILEVPTVATRVGGFPDVVLPGETGWLVPAKEPEKLAAAIGEALEDRKRATRYAQRGADLVRGLLDVKATAQDVWRVYQELIAK